MRTPQKQMSQRINRQSYLRKTPQSTKRVINSDLRDYQELKGYVCQLEAKNRSLSVEIQELLYQKSKNQKKYDEIKLLEEENLTHFQRQKKYQIQMIQIKYEEELSRLRREFQIEADNNVRQIKHKDYELKEKNQQIRYLQVKYQQIGRKYECLAAQNNSLKEQNRIITQKLTQGNFQNKKLTINCQQMEKHSKEMQSEIRSLLQVQAEKCRIITDIESQLKTSKDNEKRLSDKLKILTVSFSQLEDSIAIMKSKLLSTDENNRHLIKQLQSCEKVLNQKQIEINTKNQRQSFLTNQLEEFKKRQVRRQKEVGQLISENQRLYHELNTTRHRLHDLGVKYKVDV